MGGCGAFGRRVVLPLSLTATIVASNCVGTGSGAGATVAARAAAPVTTPRLLAPLVDAGRQAGIAQLTRTWSANFGDLDGDAFADLVLPRHETRPPLVYSGAARGFVPRPTDMTAVTDEHDCDIA